MKITDKIKNKQADMRASDPITIAFLGDSVTQGCYECYLKADGSIETLYDGKSAYSTRLRELLNLLYPNVQINIINSGISGDSAVSAVTRVDRDIVKYRPDLVVVSFGLNDCCGGLGNLEHYADALRKIFKQVKDCGAEVIFLTQNYMNTEVSCHLKEACFVDLANRLAQIQNGGILKKYFEKAKVVCMEMDIKVCDFYRCWEKMESAGVDITALLANKLNHPIREYHYYIAIKLLEKILGV